jgi:excisionase family DNA binding protein
MHFALSDEELRRLAEALAPILAQRLEHQEKASTPEGYLAPDAAARYLGVSRKRIYDLTSMRVLEPAGRDGRTPLFTRATLDAYVRRAIVGRAPTGANR